MLQKELLRIVFKCNKNVLVLKFFVVLMFIFEKKSFSYIFRFYVILQVHNCSFWNITNNHLKRRNKMNYSMFSKFRYCGTILYGLYLYELQQEKQERNIWFYIIPILFYSTFRNISHNHISKKFDEKFDFM